MWLPAHQAEIVHGQSPPHTEDHHDDGEPHTTAETVFRRYAKFIPNLTRKDGSAASRWLAEEGL
jgi:hypothetical protein